jgi:4-hydroxythreonine-4-phosphate dehydrogenase
MLRIGISIGDPAGIGPEIILDALSKPLDGIAPVVFGSEEVLRRADAVRVNAGLEPVIDRLRYEWKHTDDKQIGLVEVANDVDLEGLAWGRGDARAATIQLRAFREAMDAAADGEIDAIVTAPWTKSILQLIDEPPTGHTELLAERFGAPDHVMMLAGDRLRVSLVTTHLPLRDVADRVTPERLEATIRTTIEDVRAKFGVERPRVAVLGLNPHAGEAGTIGTEDRDVIAPVVSRMRIDWADRAEISGPHSADTFFAGFRDAQPYDAVVCMYHDQGLIPLKTLHFGRSANITLGLPIVRTSVDHGTAWDIAGQGVADATSMRYAIEVAADMATRARGGAVSPDLSAT